MKLRQISFKIISMIMVFTMLFSISATTISAVAEGLDEIQVNGNGNKGDTNGDGTIKYVSIGDSMTNGYGFDGYNQDMHTINRDEVHLTPDVYNFFDGTGVYGNGSYALQFENYLKGIYGANNVEHTKLALSAFRAEDLLFLIDDSIDKHDQSKLPLKDGYFNNSWGYVWDACEDYDAKNPSDDYIANFDGYVWGHEPGTSCGASGYVAYHLQMKNFWGYAYPTDEKLYQQYEAQFAELKSYFQNSLIDADVISLALGNAAFDAYFMDRLFMIWGDEFNQSQIWKGRNEITIADIKEQLCETDVEKAMVDKIYEVMKSVVAEKISDEDYSAMKMDRVCQLMTYVTFSYMYSYKQVIKWIGNNNPDAQVMIVGLLNSHHGITMTQDGEMLMDMGEGMGAIYEMMNIYVAGVAADYMEKNDDFTGKFLYVEQPENPEMIATVIGELDQAGWGLIDCGVAGCEDCANGKACKNGRLDGEIVRVKTIPVFVSYFAKPMGYWYAGAKYTSGLFSSDMELLAAVQNAIDSNLDVVTVAHNLMGTPNDSASPYWNTSTVAPLGAITANVIYLACEQAMVTALESSELEVEALVSYADGSMGTLLNSVDKTILPTNKPGQDGWADTLIPTVDEDGNAITLKYIYDYFYEFYTSDEMLPMMRFLAINKVGNGIAAHPTPANHDRLAANMIAAYENDYTVQDKCQENASLITLNKVYYTLSQKNLLSIDQTNELIDVIVDAMLLGNDSANVADAAYEVIFLGAESDAKRVELIEVVYNVLKESDSLNDVDADLSLVEELCATLDKYATDEQIVAIIDYAYECMSDEELSEDEYTDIAKFVYVTLLRNPELSDTKKLALVGEVYSILKTNNYINDNKALDVVEEIYNSLTAEGLLSDSQAVAIMDYVYDVVEDGVVTESEIFQVVKFAYNTIKNSAAVYARSGAVVINNNDANAAKALRIILGVVSENYLDDENKASVEKLITGEDALLNDALLIKLVDNAISVVEESENESVDVAVIVEKVVTTSSDIVLNDPDTDDSVKLEIVTEIGNIADNNISSDEEEEDNSILTEGIAVLNKIYYNLKAAGLMSDKEVMDIIRCLYNVLTADEINADTVVLAVVDVYSIIFEREDLTLEQKGDILVIVYETLEDEGYFTEENIINAITTLYNLIVEYHDEAYAYAYAELYAAGYIDELKLMLLDLQEQLDDLNKQLKDLEVEEQYRDLVNLLRYELTLTDITIRQLVGDRYNDGLLDYPELDEATWAHLETMLYTLLDHLYNVNDIILEVGEIGDAHVTALVVETLEAVEELLIELATKAYDHIVEMAPVAYDALVSAIVEAVKKYAPMADEFLYDWLYNNPDKVIGFFEEYGDDIVGFIVENSDVIFSVIGFIAANYGEDILVYVFENADVIIPAIVEWVEKYGDDIWALVEVYLDALGISLELDLDPEVLLDKFSEIVRLVGELAYQMANDLIDYLEALGILEEIQAEIETLYYAIYDHVAEKFEVIKDDLIKLCEKLYNEAIRFITEDLGDIIIKALKVYGPEVAEWIYDWLYNNPEKVIEFFCEYGDDIVNFLKAHAKEITAIITYIVYNYGEDMLRYVFENADVIFPAIIKWFEIHGSDVWALVKVYLDALGVNLEFDFDLSTPEGLINAFTKVVKLLGKLIDMINKGIYDYLELLGVIEEINAALAELKAYIIDTIETQLAALESYVQAQIAALKAEIEAQIAAIKAEIEAQIAALKAELEKAAEEVKAQIEAEIARLEAQLKAEIAKLEAKLEAEIARLEAELKVALAELDKALQEGAKQLAEYVYEEINKFVDDAVTGKFTPTEESYYVSVNGGSAAYAEMLAITLAEKLDVNSIKLGNTVWGDLDYDMLAAADLITIGYDENEISGFAVNQMLAYIVNYLNVTLRGSVEGYVNGALGTLANAGYPIASKVQPDVVAQINGIIDEIVNFELIAGREQAELDWAGLVGAENVKYVEKLLAKIKAELLASGVIDTYVEEFDVVEYVFGAYPEIGEVITMEKVYKELGDNAIYTIEIPVVDSIVYAAESYLYGFLQFQVQYGQLIHDLFKINPDATVILLGHYNAYDMELALGDVVIDLSEAYSYVAGVSSIQPFAYALVSENIAYVDIYEAETEYEALVAAGVLENTLLNFVMMYLTDSSITDASEAGNEYIHDQIMNILTLGCDHKYDNACDAECNKCGFIREVGDHVYDNACDADCNECGFIREVGDHEYDENGVCIHCGATKGNNKPEHVHVYDGCTDTDCNLCGEIREAGKHVYDYCDDTTCANCGVVREARAHVYTHCEDKYCNQCGKERVVTGHIYSNACDATCNRCGRDRDVVDHVYSGCNDATCNECGAERTAGAHVVDDCEDNVCNVCGQNVGATGHKYGAWVVTKEATRKTAGEKMHTCAGCGKIETRVIAALGGISGGAIAAIVIGSVVVAGAAGFAIYWFLIQKKTFAALVAGIKSLFGGEAATAAVAPEVEAPAAEAPAAEEAPANEE